MAVFKLVFKKNGIRTGRAGEASGKGPLKSRENKKKIIKTCLVHQAAKQGRGAGGGAARAGQGFRAEPHAGVV